MASHPYISGAGNISQMIGFLRKNFPASITSETVKKLGVAPNNESYVINALQFIGIVDEEGKRTPLGQEVFTKHDDVEFQKAFVGIIKNAYKELFDLRGDDAWTLDKAALIGYFRSADKTSEVIGSRQASVFQIFQALAGHAPLPAASKNASASKPIAKSTKPKTAKSQTPAGTADAVKLPEVGASGKKGMALTVRIEINLPSEASAETYDNIFKSIRANLLNE